MFFFSGAARDGLANFTVGGTPSFVSDRCGAAAGAFATGSSSYLTAPAPAGLPLGNAPRTLMMWVLQRANVGGNGYSFMFMSGTVGWANAFALLVTLNAPYFWAYNDDIAQ